MTTLFHMVGHLSHKISSMATFRSWWPTEDKAIFGGDDFSRRVSKTKGKQIVEIFNEGIYWSRNQFLVKQ